MTSYPTTFELKNIFNDSFSENKNLCSFVFINGMFKGYKCGNEIVNRKRTGRFCTRCFNNNIGHLKTHSGL